MNATREFTQRMFIKKLERCFLMSLLLIAGLTGKTAAYESFSPTLSFFQGFDLMEGVKVSNPNHVTVVFGPAGRVEILPPEEPLTFGPEVDFYFGYEATAQNSNPVVFVPENIVAMAVLTNTAFETVSEIPTDLDKRDDPFAISIESNDIVVLLTSEHTYFKIGNIKQQPDLTTVSFTYQQLERNDIPEPTPLLLLGLGLIALIGLLNATRRTTKRTRI
jgi:hypothetical protein